MKTSLTDLPIELGHRGGVEVHRLIKPGQSQGKVATYNYATLKPGMNIAPHKHDDGREYFLFLDGSGVMTLDSQEFEVHQEDFMTVELGVTHTIENTGSTPLVFISLRTIEIE